MKMLPDDENKYFGNFQQAMIQNCLKNTGNL